MSSSEFKALSQDDLRKQLYQTFKNRGVLDTLKMQLRKQLIHELMNPVLCREILPKATSSECSSLIIVACNSLVADHLRRCGYEYSLSVFYPESGLEKDKELSIQDLLQLIRISPTSDLYKMLISDLTKTSMKGFLVQMLTELVEYNFCKETCSAETQTSSALYKESLAEKLQLIDEQFADMYPQRHLSESFHVKLAEYKREIEQQLQAEMSQKLQHFKDVEIAKIKMDERAKSQKEISELRKEFQRDHRAKSEALISRERNAIERLHKQQEIDAKEIYLQRQTLLKDIETVRSREEELKKRIEVFEIAQKLQESKNKTVEDSLHQRENNVKNIEETYDQKLKNELLNYQLELKEEYITRTKKFAENEREQKEKAMLLHEENIALNSKKKEFSQAVLHAKELELEIDSIKAQALLLSKQNQLLTEKLKEVSDYPTLKEEKIKHQAQNKLLEQQLEEAHNENLRLQDKLSRLSSDFKVLQAELKRMEHAKKLECEESETHKQVLEKQLQKEMDHCVQLKDQLSDYENTIRKLNIQIEELKLQWKQTQTDITGSSLAVPLENANQPLSPILRIGDCASPDSACSSPLPNKQKLSLYQELENHQNISNTVNPVKLLDEEQENHNPVSDYQEDIPEQFKSDVSQPSGDIVSWNHVPASMPATGISQQEISGTEKTVLEGRHHEEQKESEWEEEKAEEEKTQSGKSSERDQGEPEKPDKEIHVQESLEMDEEIQNEIVTNMQTSTLKSEEHSGTDVSNPLEKYMKIIQQNQDKEQEKKKAEKEAVEISSAALLGSEREDSVSAADIPQEGLDDNFW
ncbi:centriole and centriolar satellite protein OFD1 isoform X3 [Pantherophis guttatus]|uniref:Centriole and centriolar satellite protein OFD1 isoform X3 n=1 Tax=Pantherophis guttatus TaxID=94885 RepID=A0A6P9D4X5_PANGU|nr:centriole and centriolar satellite protein OFD1 isoform X3 [Pantherophis guttatus]